MSWKPSLGVIQTHQIERIHESSTTAHNANSDFILRLLQNLFLELL